MPRNAPSEDRGIGETWSKMRAAGDIAEVEPLFRKRAIMRTTTVSIAPDKSPAATILQSLNEINPASMEEKQRIITEIGRSALKGSFVPKRISVKMKDRTSADTKEIKAERREHRARFVIERSASL